MDLCLLDYAYLEYTPSVCGLGDRLPSRASVGAMQLFEKTFQEILIVFASCIAPQRMLMLTFPPHDRDRLGVATFAAARGWCRAVSQLNIRARPVSQDWST